MLVCVCVHVPLVKRLWLCFDGILSIHTLPFYLIKIDWIYCTALCLSLLVMNYFRECLACGPHDRICGGSGRYAPLEKDDLLFDGVPSLRPVRRIIRLDLLQMLDETDEDDDADENLVGLAFVKETKHQKTSFEAFMETDKSDSEEKSMQDVQLCTWSSFASLSADEDDYDYDDSCKNWNISPVRSFGDGSSCATRIVKNTSTLSIQVSPTKELSQGTMSTASTWTTCDAEYEYGEI